MGTLASFFQKPRLPRGGLSLPTLRYPALGHQIQVLPQPPHVFVRYTKGGKPLAKVRVTAGAKVQKGQPIAWDDDGHHVLHAPVHGTVSDTDFQQDECNKYIYIQSTNDISSDFTYGKMHLKDTPDALIDRLREAGLTGMGGAGFPTWRKVRAAQGGHTLILNGIECEPMLSCDAALMAAEAEKIVRGGLLLAKMMGNPRIFLAIEADKPHAEAAMRHAIDCLNAPVDVRVLPVMYPQGGEKQLIEVLLGTEVPSGSNAAAQGILMQNVMTAFATAEAVEEGKPLTKRLVTITGAGIEKPGNYWVPVGTPVAHVLNAVGADDNTDIQYFLGGPLMGHPVTHERQPVGKGSSALIALPAEKRGAYKDLPCIRCGACVDVCPVGLMPQDMLFTAQHQQTEQAHKLGVLDCIECGLCAYACPSEIPLVRYFKTSKAAVRQEQKERERAQYINKLVKAREERIERRKAERLAEKERRKAERQQKADANAQEVADERPRRRLSPEQRAKIEQARAKVRKGKDA